jgi:hypothetical protein
VVPHAARCDVLSATWYSVSKQDQTSYLTPLASVHWPAASCGLWVWEDVYVIQTDMLDVHIPNDENGHDS